MIPRSLMPSVCLFQNPLRIFLWGEDRDFVVHVDASLSKRVVLSLHNDLKLVLNLLI